jgi:hypothetical protein
MKMYRAMGVETYPFTTDSGSPILRSNVFIHMQPLGARMAGKKRGPEDRPSMIVTLDY